MKWSYALTVEEEALACRLGFERQLPMLGQPQRNRNYSEGDIWEAWQHMVTVGSEIAAAQILGLTDFVPHVNTFKSRQDIPGYEIRYSFNSVNGPSLRFNASVDKPEEIYILIAGGLEVKTRRVEENNWKGAEYVALGWLKGFECARGDYLIRGNSYRVPWRELNPMEVLP
jgi:hypothetical protein